MHWRADPRAVTKPPCSACTVRATVPAAPAAQHRHRPQISLRGHVLLEGKAVSTFSNLYSALNLSASLSPSLSLPLSSIFTLQTLTLCCVLVSS